MHTNEHVQLPAHTVLPPVPVLIFGMIDAQLSTHVETPSIRLDIGTGKHVSVTRCDITHGSAREILHDGRLQLDTQQQHPQCMNADASKKE